VAIVALLKDLGTSRRLITLIEGEAMLNDGTAMVAFLILLDIVQGNEATPGQIIAKAFRLSGGGPLFGLFGGIILSFILRRINNNSSLEINTTLFVSYTVYFVAEYSEV
jgi:NhaP-type Na+/H+ or K+/H+ antiporter